MKNTCGYSDEWQPYMGDYDKFEYDIELFDGRQIDNCYPNGGLFNQIETNQCYSEDEVARIRFSENPHLLLNHTVSARRIPYPIQVDGSGAFDGPTSSKVFVLTNPYPHLDRFGGATPESPRRVLKVGRNDPCGCGSGRKSKQCCGVEIKPKKEPFDETN